MLLVLRYPVLFSFSYYPKPVCKTSNTRIDLLSRLKSLGYLVLEYLLSPLQFGIPNSRLRYYLLAKLVPLPIPCADPSELATNRIRRNIPGRQTEWTDSHSSGKQNDRYVREIRQYLDDAEDTQAEYAIPYRVLRKWGRLFDIVLPSSRRSCCFTRGLTFENIKYVLADNT